MTGSQFFFGCGALLAGGLIWSRLALDVRSGVTSSNWGTWRRDTSPLGFRWNTGVWAVVATLWCGLGVLTVFHLIPVPTQWF